MKSIFAATTLTLGVILGANQVNAAQITLYNGSLGTSPASQGELISGALLSTGFPTAISETLVAGGVQVDTDGNSAEYAGYSNYNPTPPTPSFVGSSYTLDQSTGYRISFNVSLNSTTSNANNRAAFSITAIGVGNQGIELGFESNSIFAQNFDFSQGESTAIDTSQNINYELRVIGTQYFLFANSSQILTGLLRTYSFNPATSSPPLTFNPYTIPNFIFFGDNTGQEHGVFTFRSASFDTIPFEFSPGLGLLILGAGLGLKQLRKKIYFNE